VALGLDAVLKIFARIARAFVQSQRLRV